MKNLKQRFFFSATCILAWSVVTHSQANTAWNAGIGDWGAAGNWSDGVPSVTDEARISNGGTAQVTDSGRLAEGVTVGFGGGNSGTLEVSGGGATLALESSSIVGGLGGVGSLLIQNGGTLTSAGAFFGIGLFGGEGSGVVDGSGSELSHNGIFLLVGGGDDSTGTLTISNGGVVNSNGGNSSLRLSTEGGVSGILNIGNGAGAGILNASQVDGGVGAVVNFNHTDADYFFTQDGTSGGAAMNIVGDAVVNHIGSGKTTLTGANTYTGETVVRNGTLSVTGSITHTGSNLTVGDQSGDLGTLEVSGTGAVSNNNGYIGSAAGSTGLVRVSGGSWINSADLLVGSEGNGTLEISGSGAVSNVRGIIGDVVGSTGLVRVSGGSWTSSSFFYVGKTGDGTLEVSGTGSVANKSASVGRELGSTGLVKVSGGSWMTNGSLEVGGAGDGTMEISGTGAVSNTSGGFIGSSSSGTGIVKVSGGSWTNSWNLTVGWFGDGTLEVSGTGAVSSNFGDIGDKTGSIGLAKVSGGSWANSGSLTVGRDGNGTLEVSGTGQVSATEVIVAFSNGSNGTINLKGGTLTTGQLSEGDGTGGGTVTFDGGTLQLADDQAALFSGFEMGDVTLASGGGTIDTQESTVDSAYALSGVGGFTKQGTGSLTLTGANTYAGETTVRNGTLAVTGSITHTGSDLIVGSQSGDNGMLKVEDGGVVTANSVILAHSDGSTGSATLSGGTLATSQVSEGAGVGGGTFAFDGGTLQLTASRADLFANFEAGDVTLAAGGGTIDTQAFTVASSAALSGAGGLTKDGTGSLMLSGANTYTGATGVDAGSLYVEGSLGNTAVTVNTGALLGGSGSIAGGVTVQSGGTLAPGSSPGILTVGSLDLLSGSTTAMELDGLTPGTQHDQVVVNGTANLEGALELDLTGGFFVNGDSFTLIDADAINNDFASISYLYDLEIVYGTEITDDYIFTIIAIETDFANLLGLDPELAQIAQLIDDNFADAGLIPIINELNLLMVGEQPAAFEEINPQELTALSHFTFANARGVSTRLKNRQRDVRNGATGFSTAGFNLYDETGQHIRQSLLADNSGTIPAGTESQGLSSESKLSSYITGSGTMRDFDGDSSGPGYEDDSFSVLLGADYRLADNLALGAYLGYNHTNADFGGDGGNADLDSYRLGLTGTHWNPLSDGTNGIKRSYYTTAHAGIALHDYATDRKAFGGTASGDTDAFEFDLGAAIGYEVDYTDFVLTTELSLDYVNLDTDGFTETGSAAPLAIADDNSESLSSTLSLRFDFSRQIADVNVLPYALIGWRHEFMDDSSSVAARFAASPGVGGFTVKGANTYRDSLIGSLGMTALLSDGLTASVGYFGEFSPDFQSHSLSGSINFAF